MIFYLTGVMILIGVVFGRHAAEGRSLQETRRLLPASRASDAGIDVDRLIFENQSENYATHWYASRRPGEIKGVALVIHGLNLRPAKMQSIISTLTEAGIEVLGVSLRGHGDNFSHRAGVAEDQARLEAFKAVSYPLWFNEAYLAYTAVQKRAADKNVPLFFVGFSLGGLVGLDLFASQADVRYDRMVLFAPAIKLHAFHYLARLFSPFPRIVIPSLAPDDYLSNKQGTPVAAYNALFEGLRQFENHANPQINVPTLIFIDPDDEFIPLGSLRAFIEKEKLDRWELYIVEKEAAADQGFFHHHIIDEDSTGKSVWHEMMKTAIGHLLD